MRYWKPGTVKTLHDTKIVKTRLQVETEKNNVVGNKWKKIARKQEQWKQQYTFLRFSSNTSAIINSYHERNAMLTEGVICIQRDFLMEL